MGAASHVALTTITAMTFDGGALLLTLRGDGSVVMKVGSDETVFHSGSDVKEVFEAIAAVDTVWDGLTA